MKKIALVLFFILIPFIGLNAEGVIYDCGHLENADFENMENEEVLECMGEKIINNCGQAKSVIITDDLYNLEYVVKGFDEEKNKCEVYIREGKLNDMTCFFDIEEEIFLTEYDNDPGSFGEYIINEMSDAVEYPEMYECYGPLIDEYSEESHVTIKEVPMEPYVPDTSNDYVVIDKKEDDIKIVKKESVVTQRESISIFNNSLYKSIKGRIMLKVEESGEAYYVHFSSKNMHYLGKPDDAFQVMRDQGVGITNNDLYKIPVGIVKSGGLDSDGDGLSDYLEGTIGLDANKSDTDGDGYKDGVELLGGYNPWGEGNQSIDNGFADKQKGKILLQVENKGEAWYVSPEDGKRYFLGRPADAYNVMRNLGLGISNNDFDNL